MKGEEEQDWIESPHGWEDDNRNDPDDDGATTWDLFADTDPRHSFTYKVTINSTTSKTLHLNGYKLDSDETARSTGVTLWQAAPRLANYLQQQQQHQQVITMIQNQRVLELGAGLGLCGIVAHVLGAQLVVMTDGDTQTLQQMRQNAAQAAFRDDESASSDGGVVQCRQLIWGSPHMEAFQQTHGTFDVILGADVIYTKASTEPLMDTVAHLLEKPHGQFILSRYNKWNGVSDETVLQAAKERKLHCIHEPAEGIFVFGWTTATAASDSNRAALHWAKDANCKLAVNSKKRVK